MYTPSHLTGRAYYCLLGGGRIEQAEAQFNFVLSQTSYDIPSLFGKASIAYKKQDYPGALTFYRRALRAGTKCSAEVRLGIGLCLFKLGDLERARLAFERAIEFNPNCIGALLGLATVALNTRSGEGIRRGVKILSKAHSIDSTNPVVLNHLANHFFFKHELDKARSLALRAFQNTENEAVQAESCYQVARCFHIEGDYDLALEYYHRATTLAAANFVLPRFRLGQMYIAHGKNENAISCFEKVLEMEPDNYETMKILASLYLHYGSGNKRNRARDYFEKVTRKFPDDIEAWIELAEILERSDTRGALQAYERVRSILLDEQLETPPEVLNNLAALKYRVGRFDEARELCEDALGRCRLESCHDESYYRSISVTINYNLAKVFEGLNSPEKAAHLYKLILKEYPSYIDCYLRCVYKL